MDQKLSNWEKTQKWLATRGIEELMEIRAAHYEILGKSPKSDDAQVVIKHVEALIQKHPHCPKFIKVRAIDFVTVDGQKFAGGTDGSITEQQFAALARHFEKLS